MTYGVKLPDGRIIGFQDSTPREEAQLIVRRDFPEAFKKKEGLGAEFSEGLASLIGGTKTALTAPFDPKGVAKQSLLEEQARGAEFESGVSLDKLKKAYEERGLLGGAGELTRQVPLALSGMAPQIATSLGSAATGARIGSVAGLPGIIGGALGGFGASFLPMAGQNITRQAQEQEAAGQQIDPRLLPAYGGAAGQASLETAALGFTLGKRVIGKVLGQSEKEIAEGLAKNATKYEADLVKAAESKLLPTVGRGAARGLVELPTEVAQQIIERAQAGLELFSPDAIKEYGEAAYQATLVGPTLGGAAGPLNRAQARGELQDLNERRRLEQAGIQTAEEQAYKASPEYVAELVGRRDQIQEEMSILDGILKGKAQTDEEKQLKREAAVNRKNLRFELDQITENLREVAPETAGLPLTLAQRKEQDKLQKQTKAIAATSDLVTDEFGNIVPGLTKSGAVAGRELTLKEKAKADNALFELKMLYETETKRKLNAQEEQQKALLQQEIDEIRSTSDFARDYVDAKLATREGYTVTSETLGRYDPKEGIPLDVSEPGLIRQKGLEQLLTKSGKPVTPNERKKLEASIDAGVLTKDVKNLLGLGAEKELGQNTQQLIETADMTPEQRDEVLENARLAYPILQERLKAYKASRTELLDKKFFDAAGNPTKFYSQAIANEAAYVELERLANAAKRTIDLNKDKETVGIALMEAKRKLPQSVDLVAPNLSQLEYQKEVRRQIDKQQEIFDDIRLALDDLASGEFIGSGVKAKVKYDKEGNILDKDAKELKQKYDALSLAYKKIYPTFESYYQEKASVSANTKQTLVEKLQKIKQEYITSALVQADAYRKSNGLDPLTEGEAKSISEQLDAVLTDAIARGQLKENEFAQVQSGKAKPIYEEVTIPAQMRAGKIARPAYTTRKIVGYENLDTAQEAPEGTQPFLSREYALGSVGFDYGPRLPANLVKDLRAFGIGARATGQPSERMTGLEKSKAPQLVEHRGYVQDKLAQIKYSLMRGKFKERKPGETGGPVKRIPKERDILLLQKTEKQPKETDQKRIDRLLDNALNVGSRLQNQLGLPRNAFNVGRTLIRAATFVKGKVEQDTRDDVDNKQIDNVLDLIDEQLYRFKLGQDVSKKYAGDVAKDINTLLDSYADVGESKQADLFTQSKKIANRQLKDIKDQIEELGRVKDLKDIGSLAELNKRLKETEEWLTQFAKPSGMGRATLASALRRPAFQYAKDPYFYYAPDGTISEQTKTLQQAAQNAKEESELTDTFAGYVRLLKEIADELSQLNTDYRFANIPGFVRGVSVRTEEQQQRKQQYLDIRTKFIDRIKDIESIIGVKVSIYEDKTSSIGGPEVYVSRKDKKLKPKSVYETLLTNASSELEEVLMARFAHHKAVIESIKTAPERHLHALKMRTASQAKMEEYDAKLKVLQTKEFNELPATKKEREETLEAKKAAEQLFKYSEETIKSIESALDVDKVRTAVNADQAVVEARKKLNELIKQFKQPTKEQKQIISVEGKKLRDERMLLDKTIAERVKAAAQANAQIVNQTNQYRVVYNGVTYTVKSSTKVNAKSLETLQKQRAAGVAFAADQMQITLLEDKIARLEAQKLAGETGVIPKEAKKVKELTPFADVATIIKELGPKEEAPGIEIAVNKNGTPKKIGAQQDKALTKARIDLQKAKAKMELAASAVQKLAITPTETKLKSEEEQAADKTQAVMIMSQTLDAKKNEYQNQIYAQNKLKAPKELIDELEKKKEVIKQMIGRLLARGERALRDINLESIESATDFVLSYKARKEIKASTAENRMSLQELEDTIKDFNAQAIIAAKLGNKANAAAARASAKELQSLLDAEKNLLRSGNNPEKAVRQHALRTGANSFARAAEAMAKKNAKDLGLQGDAFDKYVATNKTTLYNKELNEFYSQGQAEAEIEDKETLNRTMFRNKPGKSGGIDMAVADSFINDLIKKQGFDPTRRAVTTAIGAFSLPIKIPKLADVNADFRKMIIQNALSGLALGIEDNSDFSDKFYEKHGTYWPDAMGDLEYSADRVTEGVLTLVENTTRMINKNETISEAKVTIGKNLNIGTDKALLFDETFNDEIFKALRKLYNKDKSIIHENFVEYAKEENQKYFNEYIGEMLLTDRGQITNDWHKAHSALYINDSVEYGATVAQAYKKALQAVGLNTQQAEKAIEEANTKTVMLATGVKFIYAKNISDAPQPFINDAIAAGKKLETVRGGVMPDGTVIVIGDAHTDLNDMQETIEHELIGHYAVDTLLGPEGMKALVKKVFAGGEEGVLKLATELGVYDDVAEAFAAAKGTNMSEEAMRMLVTREMVAHTAELRLPSKASQTLKNFIKMIVNAVRQFFTSSGFDNMPSKTTQEIFNLIREAKKQYEAGRLGAYRTPDGNTAFLAPTIYSGKVQKNSIDVVNKLFPKKKTVKDKLFANVIGLPGYTQFIDRLAPAEQIVKKAESAGMIDALNALETTTYLRLTDQRLNMTAQATTSGVPQLVKNADGETEVLGKKDGANLIKVGNILQRAKMLGNSQAINNLFGLYLVSIRAKRVGLKTLASDLRITEKELNDVVANIKQAGAEPIFKEAAKVYTEYNKDLINFAVQTGAISKELGAELNRYGDYVPFYRVREGIAQLVISKENVINVGRLTDQPYLDELVGGKEMLMNFEESAFQNTAVLVDMGLRNLATSKLVQQLEKIGDNQTKIATRVSPKITGTDIVRAKVNGVDAAWRLNTKGTPFEDIPADLLIKGLDGIKLQIPVAIKLLGLPSRWLRTMIIRDPAYSVRQIIKDSTAMWLYSGANAKPVIDALKEIGPMLTGTSKAEEELQRAGLVGGQLFTGMPEDMSKIMLQITSGKTGWQSLLAKLDRMAMKGDAATRVAMYISYLKQGMTPMRAKLAVLESLNVNKRGLSPSVYWLSTLVPFMNTQVQGLTMFAKAMSGKNDLAGQKDLRMKLFKRGTYVALFTLMYAAYMQDDEAYKNADPFTKYNSWFIRLPFLKEPLRVPTPFEFGYVFKALPEAVFNMMFNDEKASNVLKFFRQAASNSLPISLPQAIKPAIEATAGFSFFTGQDIESARERGMLPGYRDRPQTTEFAKALASLDKENLSPVMLDYLAKGYGGSLTIALTSMLNPVLAPTSDVAAPTKMPSQYPIVGGFFQPNDASGVINAAYETAERAQKASKTFNEIIAKGNKDEAQAFARKFANDLLIEDVAGAFKREMGELAAVERAVRADKRMSSDEKAEKIKQLRAIRIKMSEGLNKISARE